jgi:2-polyprenyl-3-methyl-5-hydroxy-6-metoxy-1,4-benzoquinol methylase
MTRDVAEIRIKCLSAMLSDLSRFSPKRERLLDIGCNRGLLLEAGRRAGWQVVGVELSAIAAARARADYGLDVRTGLEDLIDAEPFHLAIAWHVLEHTADPVDFLRRVASLLAPDGVIALQVPSFDFVEEFARQSKMASLVCAVHNYYFTEVGLCAVLQRVGLEPKWILNDPKELMLTSVCSRVSPNISRSSDLKPIGAIQSS